MYLSKLASPKDEKFTTEIIVRKLISFNILIDLHREKI